MIDVGATCNSIPYGYVEKVGMEMSQLTPPLELTLLKGDATSEAIVKQVHLEIQGTTFTSPMYVLEEINEIILGLPSILDMVLQSIPTAPFHFLQLRYTRLLLR